MHLIGLQIICPS